MKSPGIEVKRIKQIAGTSNFNEVFFTDVRVPDSQRLGAVGEGWRVAIATLMNERLAVGPTPAPDFPAIFQLCRPHEDRKSDEQGKSGAVSVDLGGGSIIKKKKQYLHN